MKQFSLGFIALFALACCASLPAQKPVSAHKCEFENVQFKTDFEGARLNGCTRLGDGTFALTISPEDNPINPSAWYAFDIVGAQGQTLNIALDYDAPGYHRYTPKVLRGDQWEALLPEDVDLRETQARFTITPDTDSLRIAAQPLITTQDHNRWIEDMAQRAYVKTQIIGQSREGRPIRKLEEIDGKNPFVVILGRQHPPETTGAQSLKYFVETVWGESALAQEFRSNFNLLIVPMVNPDGVAAGNWRHNMGGLDLNRDWGPFTQPETQAVAQELERFATGQDSLAFFLDFHSTWRNLLYTQTDEETSTPDGFTRDWVANVKARLPAQVYDFTREASITSDRPIAKNYIYRTYQIPAITFEVGDNTQRADIEAASLIFAEEMMTLLLSHQDGQP